MTTAKEVGLTTNPLKLQTCQQSDIHLKSHRKVHALTTKPTLYFLQSTTRLSICLQRALLL